MQLVSQITHRATALFLKTPLESLAQQDAMKRESNILQASQVPRQLAQKSETPRVTYITEPIPGAAIR